MSEPQFLLAIRLRVATDLWDEETRHDIKNLLDHIDGQQKRIHELQQYKDDTEAAVVHAFFSYSEPSPE